MTTPLRKAAEALVARLGSQRPVHRGRGEEWICEVSREQLRALAAALAAPEHGEGEREGRLGECCDNPTPRPHACYFARAYNRCACGTHEVGEVDSLGRLHGSVTAACPAPNPAPALPLPEAPRCDCCGHAPHDDRTTCGHPEPTWHGGKCGCVGSTYHPTKGYNGRAGIRPPWDPPSSEPRREEDDEERGVVRARCPRCSEITEAPHTCKARQPRHEGMLWCPRCSKEADTTCCLKHQPEWRRPAPPPAPAPQEKL